MPENRNEFELKPGKRKWLLYLPALVFLVSFYFSYPGVTVLQDEVTYIRQAVAYSEGKTTLEHINPLTGETTEVRPSDYPPGTSLLLTLFVLAGGWSASFWMPALCLIFAFYFTVLLLRSAGYSEWFACLYFIFLPALIMGRVASSDVLSALIIAIGWWMFWKGDQRKEQDNRLAWWTSAGFVAGVSILFRETNVLLFLPVFAGALFRQDREWYWLLMGGLAGIAVRPGLSYLLFGDPFFIKDPHFGFSLESVWMNTPVYLVMLLVFVPGGLYFAFIYKGNRRPEVITTIFLFVFFYLSYDFRGQHSGFAKSLVLGPRFFIPLLPVLYFAMAESAPRLLGATRFFGKEMISRLKFAGVAITIISIITTNILFYEWTRLQQDIQQSIIETVPTDASVVTNPMATQKYISEIQGYKKRMDVRLINPEELEGIAGFYIVFLQRSDSEYWRVEAERGNLFLNSLQTEMILEKSFHQTYHLKVYKSTNTKNE